MAICTSLIFCGAKSVWAGMRSLYSGDRVLDRGVNTQQLQTARFHKRNLEEEKFVKCSTDTNAHSNTECPNCPPLSYYGVQLRRQKLNLGNRRV